MRFSAEAVEQPRTSRGRFLASSALRCVTLGASVTRLPPGTVSERQSTQESCTCPHGGTSGGDAPSDGDASGCARLLAQDARHLLSPSELIHQLVEVAELSHQRIGQVLQAYSADNPGDEARLRIH